jgi:ADP-heptose:LPS heptosyltransferase
MSGKPNPKNYPVQYWQEVISLLANKGHEVWQIGRSGEEKLAEKTSFDMPLSKLKDFASDMDTFISVDNFFPHFCNHYNLKSGIVIFSKSDPKIFGYKQNKNLLKDVKYLRPDQFGLWDSCNYEQDAFVLPQQIIDNI